LIVLFSDIRIVCVFCRVKRILWVGYWSQSLVTTRQELGRWWLPSARPSALGMMSIWVLFGWIDVSFFSGCYIISLPLWFDDNLPVCVQRSWFPLLQFHYVISNEIMIIITHIQLDMTFTKMFWRSGKVSVCLPTKRVGSSNLAGSISLHQLNKCNLISSALIPHDFNIIRNTSEDQFDKIVYRNKFIYLYGQPTSLSYPTFAELPLSVDYVQLPADVGTTSAPSSTLSRGGDL